MNDTVTRSGSQLGNAPTYLGFLCPTTAFRPTPAKVTANKTSLEKARSKIGRREILKGVQLLPYPNGANW